MTKLYRKGNSIYFDEAYQKPLKTLVSRDVTYYKWVDSQGNNRNTSMKSFLKAETSTGNDTSVILEEDLNKKSDGVSPVKIETRATWEQLADWLEGEDREKFLELGKKARERQESDAIRKTAFKQVLETIKALELDEDSAQPLIARFESKNGKVNPAWDLKLKDYITQPETTDAKTTDSAK